MINKKIMQEIRDVLGVSDQRIYQLVEDIKKEKIVTREVAAYILAAQNKIDLSRYLKDDLLAQVRQVVGGGQLISAQKSRPQAIVQKQTIMQLGKKLEIVDSNLPHKLLNEAYEMAEVYPIIYVFENSVRYFIMQTLESKYGTNWWDSKVPRGVRDQVEKRLKDEHRWHGRRGTHKIFYSDMGDLSLIINSNWQDFKDVLPNLAWVSTRIDEFELSRNVVNHNNPLPKREIERLELYLGDWIRQITRTP